MCHCVSYILYNLLGKKIKKRKEKSLVEAETGNVAFFLQLDMGQGFRFKGWLIACLGIFKHKYCNTIHFVLCRQ